MTKNHLKSSPGVVLGAPGGGPGAILVPRAPQDRKRDEKPGSLAAPRGPQGSLKIVIFVLKPEQKVKKVGSRMHLAKIINFERTFVKPWG